MAKTRGVLSKAVSGIVGWVTRWRAWWSRGSQHPASARAEENRHGVYAPGTVVQIPASPEDQKMAERVHQYKQPPQPPPTVYLVPPDSVRPQ
jgi:hypothetical protein